MDSSLFKNRTVMFVANYAAPYMGNFIASLRNLEACLIEQGARVLYTFPENCKQTIWFSSFKNDVETSGGGVILVPSPQKKYFGEDKELAAILRGLFLKYHVDICHTHFDGYDSVATAAARGLQTKIVWHQHNHRALVDNKIKRAYQVVTLTKQYSKYGRHATIVAIGSDMAEEVRSYGFSGDLHIISNGIDINRIQFAASRLLKVHNPIRFLSLGGRAYQKGLDITLKAVKQLIDEDLEFELYITDGVDTKNTLELAFGDCVPDCIKVVNQVEDINLLFNETDLLISASRHETFSYAIAEALLAGVPVLSSNISGVQWAKGANSIYWYKSEDVDALAGAIRSVVTGVWLPSVDDVESSARYVADNYSVNTWSNKIIDVYSGLLRG